MAGKNNSARQPLRRQDSRIEGKFSRIRICDEPASQGKNAPIAVGAGVDRGSRQGIDTAEDIRIRSLPTLHRLMQNARFPVNQIRVPG